MKSPTGTIHFICLTEIYPRSNPNIAASGRSNGPCSGICKVICLFYLFLAGVLPATQAQQAPEYAVHANIIYRFTRYIDWPEHKKSGDFVIGIVGESPLYDFLKALVAGKTVGHQKIIVKALSPSSDLSGCHILFISENESHYFKKIATRTTGIPLLLVTESEGLARRGACVNFIITEDHLKLEINKKNIEQRQLSIATELLGLGIVVQ